MTTPTLTPPLTEREKKRADIFHEISSRAEYAIRALLVADQYRYHRITGHQNIGLRPAARETRAKINAIGHRMRTVEKRVKALDLTAATDWQTAQTLRSQITALYVEMDKPITARVPIYTALPVVALTAAEEDEFAHVTTVHDIDEAMRAELDHHFGAAWEFIALGIDDLSTNDIRLARMVKRRWKALRGLTTLPADAADPNLWGHDARLKSLALTPKVGSAIAISPSFAAGTLAYAMDHRGDQVHRVDAVAEDSTATVTTTIEDHKVTIRVTAEDGTTIADYVVGGNAEAYLASLALKPNIGADIPFTPAFDKAVTAYSIAAPLGSISRISASATTPGATVAGALAAGGASYDIVVTAADGEKTRTYSVTSTYSSG